MNTQASHPVPARRAFTLMEVLIAVAALAILAVGVAAIFDTTGKTVQAGRRVSNFTAVAALIEQQLRQDIEAMTRDGFLVIRNQYAGRRPNQPFNNVLLHEEDTSTGRMRRVDELMFFSKGRFRSARELLVADIVAESDAARVYYGHGQRRMYDASRTGIYLRPQIDSTHEGGAYEANALLGNNSADNPNRYASSWILLRHVTLLAPHRITQATPTTPSNPPPWYGGLGNRRDNSDIQIALQPASSNIFRSLSTRFPTSGQFPPAILTNLRPQFVTGIVDQATTDLAEIASIFNTADVYPFQVTDSFFDPAANMGADGTNAGPDGLRRIFGTGPGGDTEILMRIHAWMDDALPANSMDTSGAMTRIRCEPAPTDFVGVASGNMVNLYPVPAALEREIRRADQLMLSAHNFLPSCTEFIVEWSMGQSLPFDPSHPNYIAGREGEVIWYGMERRDANNRVIAAPYDQAHPNGSPWGIPINIPFTRVDGSRQFRTVPYDSTNINLIHGGVNLNNTTDAVRSYFGQADPTFDPEQPSRIGGAPPATNNGLLDQPNESASPTIQWPWPRMIRITISLADPNNPAIEQTFQFVFDVPAARAQ